MKMALRVGLVGLGVAWVVFGVYFALKRSEAPPLPENAATPEAPVETKPVIAANPNQAFETLARDLATPAARDRAAKQYMALTPGQLANFNQWLATAPLDVDTKNRFRDLGDERTCNPPPVLLPMPQGTMADIVDSLNQELGTHIVGARLMPPPLYQLPTTPEPFWQLISDLNEQSTVEIVGGSGDGLCLASSTWGLRHYGVSGPFACFARVAALDGTNPPSHRLELACTLACDPRLHAISVLPTLTPGPNDGSVSLIKDTPTDYVRPISCNTTDFGMDLKLSTPATQKISILNVKAVFEVSLEDAVAVVDDPESQEGKTFHVGQVNITIGAFKSTPQGFHFACTQEGPGGQFGPRVYTRIEVIDADGRRLWATSSSNGIDLNLNTKNPAPTLPLHLQFSVPIRTRKLNAEFALRDIPLPASPRP